MKPATGSTPTVMRWVGPVASRGLAIGVLSGSVYCSRVSRLDMRLLAARSVKHSCISPFRPFLEQKQAGCSSAGSFLVETTESKNPPVFPRTEDHSTRGPSR